MVIILFVYNVIRSSNSLEELLARLNCFLTQVAGAVKDLVDVEVILEQAPQEDAEPSQERLP